MKRLLFVFAFLLLPSYFKFVLGSSSLSGVSVVFLGCVSYAKNKRSKGSTKLVRHLLEVEDKITENVRLLEDNGSFVVKVLSYNMFCRPPFVRNNESDHKDGRLEAFIERMKEGDFDVLALQEIFSLANGRQRRLLDAARAMGYIYHAKAVTPPWNWSDVLFPVSKSTRRPKLIDAGLLILSRLPIVETDAHVYAAGNQIDAWAAKQCISAKIQLGRNRYCYVFNTHMQASYFDNDPSVNVVNDTARHLQLIEMSEFIQRKTQGSQIPALITGDFNVNSRAGGPTAPVPVSIWNHPLCRAHNASPRRAHAPDELEEYAYMMQTLDPLGTGMRDLLYEAASGHPVTFGDTVATAAGPALPRETVLTHTADHGSMLSIDYIFFQDSERNRLAQGVEVVLGSTRVEEFFVSGKGGLFTQLSDHYGVSTLLRVNSTQCGDGTDAADSMTFCIADAPRQTSAVDT